MEQHAAENLPARSDLSLPRNGPGWRAWTQEAAAARWMHVNGLEQFFGEGFNGVDKPNPNNIWHCLLKELYADPLCGHEVIGSICT